MGGSFDSVDVVGSGTRAHSNFVAIDSLLGAQLGPLSVGGMPHGPLGSNAAANGPVRSIQVVDGKSGYTDGEGSHANYAGDRLYVGGEFSSFFGSPRSGVAQVALAPFLDNGDNSSWSITSYDPLAGSSVTDVRSIYVHCTNNPGMAGPLESHLHCGSSPNHPGSPALDQPGLCENVYIGGTFHYTNSVDLRRYDNLARAGCAPTSSINPAFRPGQALDGAPRTMAFSAGNRLFVGGDFTMYEGRRRPGIAAFDVVDGQQEFADDFDGWTTGFRDAGGDPSPLDAMATNGDSLFVGGSFATVNGVPRANVAELSGSSVTGFDPSPNGRARAIFAPSDPAHRDRVWIGGDFTQAATCAIATVTCSHLAVVDTSVGAPRNGPADPTPSPDDRVRAFASDGSNVFVGGDFQHVGATPAALVAKYDDDGHLVPAFDPGSHGGSSAHATALAYHDGSLYVGGVDTWRGDAVDGLVKLDATVGARDPAFGPDLGTPIDEDTVRALAVANNRLLVGGGFTSYDGDALQQYVAAVSLTDGHAVSGFRPEFNGPDPIVTTITPIGGQTIIGGVIAGFDGRDGRGGLISVESPLDLRPPFLHLEAGGYPAGSHVTRRTSPGGAVLRVVMPYPVDANDDRNVQVAAEAHDAYAMNDSSYATTSGLASIAFDAIAGPWQPTSVDVRAGGARGLGVECTAGGVPVDLPDRTATVALPLGAIAAGVDACEWSGQLIAPANGSGQVAFTTGSGTQAWFGSEPSPLGPGAQRTLPAGTAVPIQVTWTSGGDLPRLRWIHVGAELNPKDIPEAAFVERATFVRQYGIDADPSPARDEPVRAFAVTTKDGDHNETQAIVEVAVDGAAPEPSILESTPHRSLTAIYASNDVVLRLETGPDAGAAGIASQRLRRSYLPMDPVGNDCDWGATASITHTDLGAAPVQASPWSVPSVNVDLPDGCYRFAVVSVDQVGNERVSTLDNASYAAPTAGWVRIDSTRPGGSVTTPIADATVNGGAVAIAGGLDQGGMSLITSVDVTYQRVAGGASGSVSAGGTCTVDAFAETWSCSWDTSGIPDGAYVLTLVVTNSTGTASIPVATTAFVDNDLPVLGAPSFTPLTGAAHQAIDVDDPRLLWVDPSVAGSFRVEVDAADGTGRGIAGVAFPTAFTGWMVDPSGAGVRTTGDAANGTWAFDYAWSAVDPLTPPGGHSIRATDGATHLRDSPMTVAYDVAAPTGLDATFVADTVTAGVTDSARISFARGTDAGSGIDHHWIERVAAPRVGGTCAPFPAFAVDGSDRVGTLDPSPSVPFVDDTTDPGTCYRYRLAVRDRVGHMAHVDTGDITISDAGLAFTGDARVVEGGTTGEFLVRLRARPEQSETVRVTVKAGAETTGEDQEFVFTHATWDQPRNVAVVALDDASVEAVEHTGDVVVETVSSGSGAPRYASIAPLRRAVTVVDDDTAGIEVAPLENARVGEGSVTSARIRLTARPSTSATISQSAGSDQITAEPVSFTPDDWNEWHEVQVRAVDDRLAEGPQDVDLELRSVAVDGTFTNLLAIARFSVIDNDVDGLELVPEAGWSPRSDALLPLAERGSAARVRVRAASHPRANVVVTPIVSDPTQVSVVPDRVTIVAGSTDPDASFTVTAVDDAEHEDERRARIEWRVESVDAVYAAAGLPPVDVAVLDDDAAKVVREVEEDTADPVRPKPDRDPVEPKAEQPQPTEPVREEPPTQIQDASPTSRTEPAPTPTPQQPVAPVPEAEPEPTPVPEGESRAKVRAVADKPSALDRLGTWAKANKATAATATGVVALGLLKGLAGMVNHLPPGMRQVVDRLGGRRLLGRAAREMARRRRRLMNGVEQLQQSKRSNRRARSKDVLDQVRARHEPTYEDPLEAFERAPGADRPDLLEQIDERINGFDVDDRWGSGRGAA